MVGAFDGGRGLFQATDTIRGRRVLVRFEWVPNGPEGPRWQQLFSYDDGATWSLNWKMTFTRT